MLKFHVLPIKDKNMAGNEIEVCTFLFSNIGNLNLKHIGKLQEIGAPFPNTQGYIKSAKS